LRRRFMMISCALSVKKKKFRLPVKSISCRPIPILCPFMMDMVLSRSASNGFMTARNRFHCGKGAAP